MFSGAFSAPRAAALKKSQNPAPRAGWTLRFCAGGQPQSYLALVDAEVFHHGCRSEGVISLLGMKPNHHLGWLGGLSKGLLARCWGIGSDPEAFLGQVLMYMA